MFEILFPTVIKDRYKLHQLLEDFKEVHNLQDAKVQYFVVPDRNAILIRSEKAFNGCKDIEVNKSGDVELFVEYCTKGSRPKESKSVVRNDEQVIKSLIIAFDGGGLRDVEITIKKHYIDNVGMSKRRSSFGIPIAQVSVKAMIDDAAKFKEMLVSGIGKRRSFGCGMVLVFTGVS